MAVVDTTNQLLKEVPSLKSEKIKIKPKTIQAHKKKIKENVNEQMNQSVSL